MHRSRGPLRLRWQTAGRPGSRGQSPVVPRGFEKLQEVDPAWPPVNVRCAAEECVSPLAVVGDPWNMVNELKPWQLTVAELMGALREHQPNAVVGLKVVSDPRGVPADAEGELTVLHNLQIPPGQSPGSPVFVLRVYDGPRQ